MSEFDNLWHCCIANSTDMTKWCQVNLTMKIAALMLRVEKLVLQRSLHLSTTSLLFEKKIDAHHLCFKSQRFKQPWKDLHFCQMLENT